MLNKWYFAKNHQYDTFYDKSDKCYARNMLDARCFFSLLKDLNCVVAFEMQQALFIIKYKLFEITLIINQFQFFLRFIYYLIN